MMNQYLSLGLNDIVDGMFWFEELPAETTPGPVVASNPAVTHGRVNCIVNPSPFPGKGFPEGPTPTSKLYWTGTKTAWVETSTETFAQRKQKAINKCFADVDAIVGSAVGNRAKEYLDAELAARAYKAAGYTVAEGSVVDEYVSSYATYSPADQPDPNKWAADVIIARADAFATAQKAMRTQRFGKQKAMQSATNDTELTIPVAAWNDFISGLRQQLGIA